MVDEQIGDKQGVACVQDTVKVRCDALPRATRPGNNCLQRLWATTRVAPTDRRPSVGRARGDAGETDYTRRHACGPRSVQSPIDYRSAYSNNTIVLRKNKGHGGCRAAVEALKFQTILSDDVFRGVVSGLFEEIEERDEEIEL